MTDFKLKIVVLMGLPGSGKTYYAEHYKETHPDESDAMILHFDNYDMYKLNLSDHIRQKLENACNRWYVPGTIVLDGTWLTKEEIIKTLMSVTKAVENRISFVDDSGIKGHNNSKFDMRYIDIVYFDGSRDICLANTDDHVKYDDVIKTAEFDTVDDTFTMELHEKFGISRYKITVTHATVEDHTHYKKVFESVRYPGSHCDILLSDSWITDGRSCDCWGACDEVTPEAPKDFDKFHELILKVCPDMAADEIDKLFTECADIYTSKDEEDYYGSWLEYTYWRCDLKKLYQMLVDSGKLII